MKVIIAGSRHMSDERKLAVGIKLTGWDISEVVCGMAKGADTLGKEWANRKGIPVKEFPADWDKYKKSAGPIRNAEMAEYADALLVFIYPNSRGSRNMFQTMKKKGKPIHAIYISE